MKITASLCLLYLTTFLSSPLHADEWTPLFNGKNLDHWKANNDPDSFTVVDGVLRIQASGNTSAHLFYVGEDNLFRNFELKATVRAEPNSNCGIFVHTDMSTRDKALHLAKGYEVQLNSSQKEKRKTGSLYGIVDYDKSPVDETEWFNIYIKVIDKRIIVKVNDQEVVDYTEPKNPQRSKSRRGRLFSKSGGMIGLQAHDKNSIWYFRDIQVKRLP